MKMNAILDKDAAVSDVDLVQLAALPEIYDESTKGQQVLDRTNASPKAVTLSSIIKGMASTPEPRDVRTEGQAQGTSPVSGEGATETGLQGGEDDEGEDGEDALDPRIQQALREFADVEEEIGDSEGSDADAVLHVGSDLEAGSNHSDD